MNLRLYFYIVSLYHCSLFDVIITMASALVIRLLYGYSNP